MTKGEPASWFARWRPLDRIGSIRTKLSILVAGAVTIAVSLGTFGSRLEWAFGTRLAVSVLVGLAIMRLVAGGITTPLREMAVATRQMADGDYSLRITSSSRDEVGRLANAFNAMSAELAEVDRQRRDLVANASHELRTPIAALQAMIENLADGVSDPDPEFVDTMYQQVRRLATLVDQLMSLSRLDSGELALHTEEASVSAVISTAIDEFGWHHPDAVVAVAVEPESLTFEVDPILVQRVLTNLLENAYRHGAAPFEVTARRVETPHEVPMVELVVADRGPGIPPEEAARVFERFQRLDRSRRSGGSGLGLAIVSGIIERHRGSIHVEANDPSGARMVVMLPQRRV
ncbi:MAG: HAMP domain-containing histidine kinase [Actinobacteria bacterium]|nr:HAMP domain-containing histidine kinase [Actinomycetota bacterium]